MIRLQNPVYEKDRWSSGRNKGFLVSILIANGVLSIIALVVFSNTVQYIMADSRWDYSSMLQMYLLLAMIECMIVVLAMPGIAGLTICQERENGNLDLLKAAGVSPRMIVLGKLFSCMNLLTVLLITSLPVFSVVFVYGGISVRDLVVMIADLWMLGLLVTLLALACSAGCRRPVTAVAASYAANAVLLLGTYLAHAAPNLLYQIHYGERLGSRIAWYHYLLLVNPIVSFYGVLNNQAGSRNAIFDMINYQGNYRQNQITQHWMLIAFAVQVLFCLLCLQLAVRNVGKEGRR